MSYRFQRDIKKKAEPLTCLPLKSYNELEEFLENPPAWRTLCKGLTPRSDYVIQNIDNVSMDFFTNDKNESIVISNYCHFDLSSQEEPYPRYNIKQEKIPKTLVCHDMANGYHDDSYIDGTTKYDAYTFSYWAGIDIFCYFSHNFITIPPLSWINIGHNHGVQVIGTVITEWGEGTTFWDEILQSQDAYEKFASQLVTIASTLNFDGWLLNIENKVNKPLVLLEFVRHLHKTLHAELKHPVLIWYDSVTIRGKLNWQNGLTYKNIDFFNACDGIFTNYSWSVEDVERSVEMAGDRVTDVFIGIDVWGRNIYGGGQYNTREAITVPYREGCSLAIFAPAWTHEAMSKNPDDINYVKMSEGLNKFQRFLIRDRALWATLWPFLNTHMPCHLPFNTSFCRGQGVRRWMQGEVISPGPWYNLRHQQYQINSSIGHHGYMLTTSLKEEKTDKTEKAPAPKEKKGIIKYVEPVALISAIRSTTQQRSPTGDDKPHRTRLYQRFIHLFFPRGKEKGPTKRVERNLQIEDQIESSEAGAGTSSPAYSRDIAEENKVEEDKKIEEMKLIVEELSAPRTRLTQSIDIDERHVKRVNSEESETSERKQGEGSLRMATDTDAASDKRREGRSTFMLHGAMSKFTASVNINLSAPESKTRWLLSFVPKERECFQPYYNDAFNGGNCLRINPSDPRSTTHRTNRLFVCDFKCEDSLIICLVTKRLEHYPTQSLNLKLDMINRDEQSLLITLVGRNVTNSSLLDGHSSGLHYVYPVYSEKQKGFTELRRYLVTNQPRFFIPMDNFYGWEVRYYTVHVPGSRLTAITCRTDQPVGGILLGHIGICVQKSTTESTNC